MPSPAAPDAPAPRFPLDHPLRWLLLLAVAHVVVRILVSQSVKWDEAEQLLWSQRLALGYGMQPPLYTWLQWGLDRLLGPGVPALALLRFGALALTYVLMYRAARELLGPRGAWWAAAGMMLLPTLGWDAIRDRTHTILATAMTCGAWWLLLRLARRPRPADFAWLGLVCGIGLLAKYSFALVVGCMLLAALSVPRIRRALLARGWWWTPLVALLVVLPHAAWLAGHVQEVRAQTLDKMEIDAAAGLARGLRSLGASVLGTVLPWTLVALWAFGAAWWRRPAVLPPDPTPWARPLLARYLALVLLALLAMAAAGASSFRIHWLLPLLCVVPLAAFAARPELQSHPRGGRYTGAVVVLALLVLLLAAARPWFDGLRGRAGELNHPAAQLGAALRQAGYDGHGLIIASDHMLAGLLRIQFPDAPALACFSKQAPVPPCVAGAIRHAEAQGLGWLLISRAERIEPGWWSRAGARIALPQRRVIELPFRMVRRGTPAARYDYVWQPPPQRPAGVQ